MKTDNLKIELRGHVTPPKGNAMIEAARQSLSPEGFEALMAQTAHQPPTPAQLVAAVEEERHGSGI